MANVRSCFIAANRDDRNAHPQCLALASANAAVGGAISFAANLDDRPDHLAILAAMIVLKVRKLRMNE
jgi:hypothetical protein